MDSGPARIVRAMAERRIPAVTFFREREQHPSEWTRRESKLDGFRGGVKNWWSTLTMRASAAEYRSLHLRAHELLRDVPLYDVSSVDLPGGGHRGHSYARIRDPSEPHRDFHLRPPLSLGVGIRLGSRTDAAERVIFGTPVATRPMRLGNNARYSGRTLLGLVPISGRSAS